MWQISVRNCKNLQEQLSAQMLTEQIQVNNIALQFEIFMRKKILPKKETLFLHVASDILICFWKRFAPINYYIF